MAKQENEKIYPVRTTHEFLYEVQKETNRFKRGAILSIILSVLLLVFVAFVGIEVVRLHFAASGIILLGLLSAALVYCIYLMSFQYRFFRRWERRLDRITHFEEKLMPELAEDQPQ
jgi:uncharacterized membrane protein YbhN (UPF0104 family)